MNHARKINHGLPIVRQAVEQFNGRVHAEAAEGGGTVIVISVPEK